MNGDNTQCPQCGAVNSIHSEICRSCAARLRAGYVEEPVEAGPPVNKYPMLVDKSLAPPPRAVPGVLGIMAFRPALVFIVLAFCVETMGMKLAQAVRRFMTIIGFDFSAKSYQLVFALIGFCALMFVLWKGYQRYNLLLNGVAAKAELLLCKTSIGSYQNSTMTACEGWQRTRVNYSGPAHTNKLRLWGPTGKSAEFKTKGLDYRDGVYLLLPDKPEVHASVCSFAGSIIPDQNGQWKVWPQMKRNMFIHIALGGLILLGAFCHAFLL